MDLNGKSLLVWTGTIWILPDWSKTVLKPVPKFCKVKLSGSAAPAGEKGLTKFNSRWKKLWSWLVGSWVCNTSSALTATSGSLACMACRVLFAGPIL